MRASEWVNAFYHVISPLNLLCLQDKDFFFLFLKILFIYSWETHRDRKAERQGEGEAGSTQAGAWHGTRFRILGSRPEPRTDAQLLSHPGIPGTSISIKRPGYYEVRVLKAVRSFDPICNFFYLCPKIHFLLRYNLHNTKFTILTVHCVQFTG